VGGRNSARYFFHEHQAGKKSSKKPFLNSLQPEKFLPLQFIQRFFCRFLSVG
jgi:hypothetical protein